MAARIRKGDTVIVIAGRDKGKTGEVIAVHAGDNRAVVRGVNVVRRHQRQTATRAGRHHHQGTAHPHCRTLPLTRLPTGRRRASASASPQDGTQGPLFAKRTGDTIDG